MKPVLVVLAAGLGSRYGRLKQLESVGPSGEAIIDYSVYDALKSGFGKVVFVIKKDIEEEFRKNLLSRFDKHIDVGYVFQESDSLPDGFIPPPARKKPWGTAHAIMMAETAVEAPFSVINADDFYGFESFREMHGFLTGVRDENEYAMAGYKLGNTLSEHGSVSRGVCDIDKQGYLRSVTELTKISRSNGKIVYDNNGEYRELPQDTTVSMNMWGFTPAVFTFLKEAFHTFIVENIDDPSAECYIPSVIDDLIREGRVRARVLRSDASWFGITYREDLEAARSTILEKIENGEYPQTLWPSLSDPDR